MGILGIENRTENWKTARVFSPFFEDSAACYRLAEKIDAPPSNPSSETRFELYWKGMRDYINSPLDGASAPTRQDLAECYNCLFPGLRDEIEKSGRFPKLQDHNYRASSEDTKKRLCRQRRLYNNLFYTEIDIVLETPNRLFVGEAKLESKLAGKGHYILVHQLIRQHVMEKILIDICDSKQEIKKEVAHFLVGDKDELNELNNSAQVKFMKEQGWLKKVLSWDDITKLTQPQTP